MTTQEALAKLKALRNEKMLLHNKKHGAGDNQFGVKLGDIRNLAKSIKTNNELARSLWKTENLDARLLSTLIIDPKTLSPDEVDQMVRSASVAQLADWVNAYVVKEYPDKESLRKKWMTSSDPWAARAGWSLTSGRIARNADGLDLRPYLIALNPKCQRPHQRYNGQ